MSNSHTSSTRSKFKVGLFTLGTLIFLGILTVYVNNRPFWWRACHPVQVTVEDATGLRTKSPVKSLGLEIGYISAISLVAEGVKLKICITAPVSVQPDTKAYVRGEGFMGDRFLELKPVKYNGKNSGDDEHSSLKTAPMVIQGAFLLDRLFHVSTTHAQDSKNGRDIPVAEKAADVQQVMTQLNGLVGDLKEAINPEEIRGTIKQLNRTLEDASKAFSPQGGLTATAQRSLIKLEDAIEQLRDQVTRINQGDGSVGMVLNDPTYAEELKKALKNLNKLLNRASDLRLNVVLGINQLSAYDATRASFQVVIYPRPDRFYQIGLAADPRGTISQTTTITEGAGTTTTLENTKIERGGMAFTLLIGKVFHPRFDLALGIKHGDGSLSVGCNLGSEEHLQAIQLKSDLYFRPSSSGGRWTALPDGRIYAIFQPFSIVYLTGGLEGVRKVNGKTSAFYGAGIRFEDEDIKLLFSFL